MEIPEAMIVERIRSREGNEAADKVDLENDAELLPKYNINPDELRDDFEGQSPVAGKLPRKPQRTPFSRPRRAVSRMATSTPMVSGPSVSSLHGLIPLPKLYLPLSVQHQAAGDGLCG